MINNSIRKTLNTGDFDKIKQYKILCSLLKDLFKKTELNYTLSVFLPECGFTDLYTEEEISKFLKISYSNLNNAGELNFLGYITKQLISSSDKIPISTQTDEIEIFSHSLDNFSNTPGMGKTTTTKSIDLKFKEIDEKYFKLSLLENSKTNHLDNLLPAKTIEEKILKYQRESEAKYRVELEREILRFKEIEISNIRIEENKKYLKKIEEIRNEYEEEYFSKYESLKKRENDFNKNLVNKEKEIEVNQYENRQKYLNQIESLKLKQNELVVKYENDLNLLNFKQEKLNFKEKDLDSFKESAARKIADEIDLHKSEFLKGFALEKAEVYKIKQLAEEIMYKANLKNEQFIKLENENKIFIEDQKNYKTELKKIEEINKEYKIDIQNLREELKILAGNEKRNYDQANTKTTENESLRTENKIFKENIFNLKQMYEERRNDQGTIVEDLKIQIKENTKQFNKIKEELETENLKMKKELNDIVENYKKNFGKENKNYNQKNNSKKDDIYYSSKILLHKQILLQKKESRKHLVDYEYNIDYLNPERKKAEEYNNYFRERERIDKKPYERLDRLEKESDELKQEIKNSFVNNKSNSENNIKNTSEIYKDYNLWSLKNENSNNLTNNQTANLEKSIVNALYEKIKEANFFPTMKNNEENRNNSIQRKSNINNNLSLSNDLGNNNTNNNEDNFYNSSKNNKENKKYKKTEFNEIHKNNILDIPNNEYIHVDKLHDTPIFNKDGNTNIYTNIKNPEKNNISDFTNENNLNNKITKNTDSKNIIISTERNKEIIKLQKELDKIKYEHLNNNSTQKNKILENKKSSKEKINIIDNLNPSTNNNIKSNRDSEQNDFSVGNITSSCEWELETNRKEKKDIKSTNNFPTKNNSPNKGVNNTPTTNPIKLKEINSNSNINNNYENNSNKKINSIKEESDEFEKENLSREDEKSKNKSVNNSGNKNNKISNNNSTEKTKQQKLNINNSNKKNKSILTNKSNSYQDFENTENLEGLNLKGSFNKFSNVNFDLDQKDNNDEEIKSENQSENYGDDFIDDVDAIDNKNHRLSFDLDAIKNISNNFTANNSYITKENRNNSKSKEKDKSVSQDFRNDKFLQSKNSLYDDNAIEGENYFIFCIQFFFIFFNFYFLFCRSDIY